MSTRKRASRAGRPPAPPELKRSRNVTVWLTPEHHAACVAAAAHERQSLSDWMVAAADLALAEAAADLAAEIAQEAADDEFQRRDGERRADRELDA